MNKPNRRTLPHHTADCTSFSLGKHHVKKPSKTLGDHRRV